MTVGLRRALVSVAWLNVVLHLAGLVLSALVLAPGAPAAALPDRLAYLARRPVGWTMGWAVWTLGAAALVGFLVLLSRARRTGLLDLSVLLAAGGATVDLVCNVLWVFVLPRIAAGPPVATAVYLTFERSALVGGLVLANGLYSFAVLLASHSFVPGTPGARPVRALGAGTFLCGATLSAAGFTRHPTHIAAATAATIVAFCVWTLAVARVVARSAPGERGVTGLPVPERVDQ